MERTKTAHARYSGNVRDWNGFPKGTDSKSWEPMKEGELGCGVEGHE